MVNALDLGVAHTLECLHEGRSGLRTFDFEDANLPTWIGRIDGLEEEPVEGQLQAFDCRNNHLAQLTLMQDDFVTAVKAARERYGPWRISVFVGTSTAGIRQTECSYRVMLPPGR